MAAARRLLFSLWGETTLPLSNRQTMLTMVRVEVDNTRPKAHINRKTTIVHGNMTIKEMVKAIRAMAKTIIIGVVMERTKTTAIIRVAAGTKVAVARVDTRIEVTIIISTDIPKL